MRHTGPAPSPWPLITMLVDVAVVLIAIFLLLFPSK